MISAGGGRFGKTRQTDHDHVVSYSSFKSRTAVKIMHSTNMQNMSALRQGPKTLPAPQPCRNLIFSPQQHASDRHQHGGPQAAVLRCTDAPLQAAARRASPVCHAEPGAAAVEEVSANGGAPQQPSSAETARTVLDIVAHGTLATIDSDGKPLGTYASYVLDGKGQPVLRLRADAVRPSAASVSRALRLHHSQTFSRHHQDSAVHLTNACLLHPTCFMEVVLELHDDIKPSAEHCRVFVTVVSRCLTGAHQQPAARARLQLVCAAKRDAGEFLSALLLQPHCELSCRQCQPNIRRTHSFTRRHFPYRQQTTRHMDC